MDNTNLYDVIIVGGGPAGVAAAVYCARKMLKTLLITENFGGQSVVSDSIHNWIGETKISGFDLAQKLENHVKDYPEMITIKTSKVTRIDAVPLQDEVRFSNFEVKTEKESFLGKAVIVASGARRRKLQIPGEDKFESKGVVYCSTCDAPLFKGKKVAVIGTGNSGLESVQDLYAYASEVYLMEYGDSIKGDPQTFEEIKNDPKLKSVMFNVKTLEILGDKFVTVLKYQDMKTNEEKTLELDGVVVAIGTIPNSEIVKDLVQIDAHSQVMVNLKHATTSHPGVYAAGDVTDDPYKQNNIAAGDGVRAALATYSYLLNRQKHSPADE